MYKFGIGYITSFNPETQSVTVKGFQGDIFSCSLDNPECFQQAPLVRGVDLEKGMFTENQFGYMCLYVTILDSSGAEHWRKIVKVWSNQKVGQEDNFLPNNTQQTQQTQNPAATARKPRKLQQGDVCIQASTQFGSGYLGGCVLLTNDGNVSLRTGSRTTRLDLKSKDNSTSLQTGEFELVSDFGVLGYATVGTDAYGTLSLAQHKGSRTVAPLKLSSLDFDLLGNITLKSTLLAQYSQLEMDPLGNISLGNKIGKLTFSPTGSFSFTNTLKKWTVEVDEAGRITLSNNVSRVEMSALGETTIGIHPGRTKMVIRPDGIISIWGDLITLSNISSLNVKKVIHEEFLKYFAGHTHSGGGSGTVQFPIAAMTFSDDNLTSNSLSRTVRVG